MGIGKFSLGFRGDPDENLLPNPRFGFEIVRVALFLFPIPIITNAVYFVKRINKNSCRVRARCVYAGVTKYFSIFC